jgi:hypothetical protein
MIFEKLFVCLPDIKYTYSIKRTFVVLAGYCQSKLALLQWASYYPTRAILALFLFISLFH